MVTIRAATGSLVEAFAELIQPAVAPLIAGDRWVALEEPDGIALFEIARHGPVLRHRTAAASTADEPALRRARRGSVELRLDPGHVVARSLEVPTAGRDYAESILENRLERLTPWKPENVMFGFAFAEPTDDGSTITVDFASTSRDLADQELNRLAPAGLVPSAIGAAGGPLETPLRIDFYRGRRNVTRLRLRRVAAGLMILIAAIVLPALAGSFWLVYASGQRLDAANAGIAAARAALLASQGAGDPALRLAAAKRPETATVFAIDRLATILPDDTYLTEMEVTPDALHLSGVSGNAPTLIPLLDAEPGLADAAFAAPVTRNPDSHDVFEIVARRAGAATTAP